MKFFKGGQLVLVPEQLANNLFLLKIRRPAIAEANAVADMRLWRANGTSIGATDAAASGQSDIWSQVWWKICVRAMPIG